MTVSTRCQASVYDQKVVKAFKDFIRQKKKASIGKRRVPMLEAELIRSTAAIATHQSTSNTGSTHLFSISLKRKRDDFDDEEIADPRVLRRDTNTKNSIIYYTDEDVEVGALLGAGGNGCVNVCHLRSHTRSGESVRLRRKFAFKTAKDNNAFWGLKREYRMHEDLSYFIPDTIVSYVGRLYKRSKREHTKPAIDDQLSPPPPESDSIYVSQPEGAPSRFSGFILEYMHGDLRSLGAVLPKMYSTSTGGIHPHVARWYIVDVFLKLRELHNVAYFYGDIKPENIMLGTDGHLRLGDFGTTMLDVDENWQYSVAGTYTFMALEWFNFGYTPYYGKRRPGDLWAAGMILFPMIFGTSPYYGVTLSKYAKLRQ
ncbi:hypothetical protein M422DRAFT_53139 [Sphaerobolus stellatus SS14]|uniref:non-specific serine/threonine protein kinase n=1 Tax=Sphaerobolus stellatus (strain SS14) TaxID=990650 RepID=A0A0C9TPL8_SPHS4|nr:hypothetical protein M422DRAFT_53139 [Sphaerobolus stellatus SS14]